MKKKELEILLQKVPPFKNPVPTLEQYITPAFIAADIIYLAHQFGDIQDKFIVDLGCGTGIFSIGAKITGAIKVIGIDIDNSSIEIARNYAKDENIEVEYKTDDIRDFHIKCDTVLMNPPFGAQKSNINADRRFIETAFRIASTVYSIHLTKTIPFLKKMISSLKGDINYSKNYLFPIKRTCKFHEKKNINYDVTLLRILVKNMHKVGK